MSIEHEKLIADVHKEIRDNRTRRIRNLIKISLWLVPLIVFGYLIYANFITSHEYYYFFDIGSKEDNYLTPQNRTSEAIIEGSYRNLTANLVYFSVPIDRGVQYIEVRVRFMDSFPNNTQFLIGARDEEEWHYQYKPIYSPKNSTKRNLGEWIIADTSFNISNLTIQKGSLSLVLSTPHINKPQYENNTISIDWISVSAFDPGVFSK